MNVVLRAVLLMIVPAFSYAQEDVHKIYVKGCPRGLNALKEAIDAAGHYQIIDEDAPGASSLRVSCNRKEIRGIWYYNPVNAAADRGVRIADHREPFAEEDRADLRESMANFFGNIRTKLPKVFIRDARELNDLSAGNIAPKSLFDVRKIWETAGVQFLRIVNTAYQEGSVAAVTGKNQVRIGDYMLFDTDIAFSAYSKTYSPTLKGTTAKPSYSMIKVFVAPTIWFDRHKLGLGVGGLKESVNDRYIDDTAGTVNTRKANDFRGGLFATYGLDLDKVWLDLVLQQSQLNGRRQISISSKALFAITKTWMLGLSFTYYDLVKENHDPGVKVVGFGMDLGFRIGSAVPAGT